MEAAERLGVEARVLRGEDASELAREGAERRVPALGVAGGDGTLAAVAGVALAADVPFVPVPFGTRNHFARDAGFDPDDPLGALEAFRDGLERRVDVGSASGRLFLNNVSLGLYASFVHDPEQRTKNRLVAALRFVPAVFGRSRRPLELSLDVDGRQERHRALVLLVANNDYDIHALPGLHARESLEAGILHAYVIEAAARRTLLALLARAATGRLAGAEGWVEHAAPSLRVESRRGRMHAAVDGEPAVFRPPLEFEIRARALRVLVPPTSRDGAEADEARS